MSMREYPSSGYTVPVASLKTCLPADKQEEFDELLKDVDEGDMDAEGLEDWLWQNMPENLPGFNLYRVADEDTPDDDNMVCGGIYAVFDEADLYVKQETPEHTAIKKLGVAPKFSRWSVWG